MEIAFLPKPPDANPEEDEGFLLRSGPRSGLKREFVFALKSQSQLSSSVGRTRHSRRTAQDSSFPAAAVSNTGADVADSISNKRLKRSSNLENGSGFQRRFTRSALKGDNLEGASSSPLASAAAASSIPGSGKNEKRTANAASPLMTPTKNKLELKMSKKIVLDKFPSDAKELLGTGLLEGLRVKYVYRGSKAGALRGKIKDGGILCYCTACRGREVLTPARFEKHAGSRNRYAMQIYLENGKNLQQVLSECKSAPLDMLEATIQSAIGSLPVKRAAICLKCKEPYYRSRVGKTRSVCSNCRELKQPQTSPMQGTDSGARSSKKGLIPKSSNSTSKRTPSQKKNCGSKLTRKSSQKALTPKSSNSTSKSIPSQKKNDYPKLTRKDLRLHKLVFMEDVLPDGTEVAYYSRGKKLLVGYKKGNGIFCSCCSSEVAPSQFEAHAGRASFRKPYHHIFTSNGVSLHELSLSLSKDQKFSANDNDDLCTICADGGNLLLCDGCPRAFHKDCVELLCIPRGKWYCRYCQSMFEKEKSREYRANAVAAGRISGVDPIEQISKRCIRIVQTPEAEVTVCVLCRRQDFSKTHFGPRTVLLCDQCEKEFHVGCLKDHNMADLKELPKNKWFCCEACGKIHAALQKLFLSDPQELPNSFSDLIKRKHEEKAISNGSELDLRWRIVSGKAPDSRLLLSKVVAIFHDCFDPIVDATTGRDLIPSMVYGRNMRDREFGGMFCAVLTVNSSVVSAGILRIFGQEVAELPLVATRKENQGQGYFQALFYCIETLLGSLHVKNLLLPAAEEAESIWTKKFGFNKINEDQLSKYTKDSHMMIFEGTAMLHKSIPEGENTGTSAECS